MNCHLLYHVLADGGDLSWDWYVASAQSQPQPPIRGLTASIELAILHHTEQALGAAHDLHALQARECLIHSRSFNLRKPQSRGWLANAKV